MIKRSWTLVGVVLALLAGCSAQTWDELRQWMEQQHRGKSRRPSRCCCRPEVSAPALRGGRRRRPFSPQKLSVAIKQEAVQPNSLLTAEINSSQGRVGAVPSRQHEHDRLDVPRRGEEGLRAAARGQPDLQGFGGNYLGQNFGRITKIWKPRSP